MDDAYIVLVKEYFIDGNGKLECIASKKLIEATQLPCLFIVMEWTRKGFTV